MRAFKWKKSEQIEDSLIKRQLVERKAFHRNLLLFVSKGWHFCSKSDYFDSNLLRGDITLSLMVLVQTTDLNQSSPHPQQVLLWWGAKMSLVKSLMFL